MKSLIIFTLLFFVTFNLYAKSDVDEHPLASVLDNIKNLEDDFQKNLIRFQHKKSNKYILTINERNTLIGILSRYQVEFKALKDIFGKKNLSKLSINRHTDPHKIIDKIIYYGAAAKLLYGITKYPNLLGLLFEDQSSHNGPVNFFDKLISDFTQETYPCSNDDYYEDDNFEIDLYSCTYPRMIDFWDYKSDIKNIIVKSDIASSLQFLSLQYLENFGSFYNTILKNKKRFYKSIFFYKSIYNVKAKILEALGHISIASNNLISKDFQKNFDRTMEPADIAVVYKTGRLSNVIFTGNWTHSLLYIGDFNKFNTYFSSDPETTALYKQKCIDLNYSCVDFVGYMEIEYPFFFTRYKKSQNTKKPFTVIEGVRDGVILSLTRSVLKVNRVSAFRSKLNKVDKAMGIEQAFSYLGLPYDYNFDSRTLDRFICTEVIAWSFMPNSEINKKGYYLQTSIIGDKTVASYAYDIVKTFFLQDSLEFVLYYNAPADSEGTSALSVEDLRRTVDLSKD